MLLAFATLIGCGGDASPQTGNLDASVPYATVLDPLVGKWASDGELALIVDRDGDQIYIRNPINDTWRFEVSNASAQETTINFTQRSFLIDGTAHPFNGVPCDATIAPVVGNAEALTYTLTSEHLPDGESDVFTRMQTAR
ncbi:hypothetical protein K239x_01680 [Planctomycetes bacterium K23_9]|uniref:Uncharacterized protein n=2 Tax=Stieleria marina TaxID=1930275 RepID=A0A517NMD0_9BACT|nr:hypothetical protein K239x_01680 [Planctomycetes bacterium K23_9]